MIDLILPWPPSTNRIWRSIVINRSARVLLSREGRDYFEKTIPVVEEAMFGQEKLTGRVAVRITVHAPDRRKQDIDNRIKIVLDVLKKGGAFIDDSQVDDLHVQRGFLVENGSVEVRVAPVLESEPLFISRENS